MLKIIGRILKLSDKYKEKLIFSFFMSFLESAMASVSLFAVYITLDWMVEGNITSKRIAGITALLLASMGLRYLFKLLEYVF